MSEQVETVIVGGGRLAWPSAYHLAQLGRSFVILDANERTGDSWRKRWDSLRLFTAYLNALPGLEFPGPRHKPSTKEEMADYLEAYAARSIFLSEWVCASTRSPRSPTDSSSAPSDQRFEADNVVLATGGYQAAHVPDFADQLDAGITQLHSSQYRRPSQLRDGDVLVVGAASSGAEIALEVSAAHRTWLSGRHPGSEQTGDMDRPPRDPGLLVLPRGD